MPRNRLEFDARLREAIGNSNVYFQPPETIKLKYPCIIYELFDINVRHADNRSYMKNDAYNVTIITKDPDYPLIEDILDLFDMARFNRFYTADNLNHYIYTIYY